VNAYNERVEALIQKQPMVLKECEVEPWSGAAAVGRTLDTLTIGFGRVAARGDTALDLGSRRMSPTLFHKRDVER
jgi:hypothetical protein